jgi:hypothetical protein
LVEKVTSFITKHTFSSAVQKLLVCVIIIENRQLWAAYLPFLPSYRPEVWSGKTKSWWRGENKCEDKPNGKTAAIKMSSVE